MKSLNSVIILFAILALFGAGLFFFPGSPLHYKSFITVEKHAVKKDQNTDVQDNASAQQEAANIAPDDASTTEDDSAELDDIVSEAADEVSGETIVIGEEGLSFVEVTDRALGSEDAPVTIYEFSSLSCGHCGDFHTNVYPQLKEDLIETGKVRLVMIDFPLNLAALRGSMLAHCLPEDQYFNFLQLLFTTQRNWLSGDYLANLKQNAQLAGLSAGDIDACIENLELEERLIARMEEAQAKWNVRSTPSFVFNDGESFIEGSVDYERFVAEINKVMNSTEKTEE